MHQHLFQFCVFFFAVFKELTAVSSKKTLYFLHTYPASWGSARDTCARYGAHLAHVSDIETVTVDILILDNYLGWNEKYQGLKDPVWIGLYQPEGQQLPKWHGCYNYTGDTGSDSIVEELQDQQRCVSMNSTGHLTAELCNRKLPYICEMTEGQCWYLPIQGKKIITTARSFSGADQNSCAGLCKSEENEDGECWGLSYKSDLCYIFMANKRHAFIRALRNSLSDAPEFITFLKICTGGEVTSLKPKTEDTSLQPKAENCTHGGDVAKLLNAEPECYCDCDSPPQPMDPEEKVKPVENKANELKESLQVSTTNISSAVRKLTSATDERSSSKSMGYFGIAMLSFVFGGLILLDLNIVIDHVVKRIKDYSNSTSSPHT